MMSDGVYWVRVNVLVSDRDVEGFGGNVYGVSEGGRGVWSSH